MASETPPQTFPPADGPPDETAVLMERWSFALESAGLGVWDADLIAGTCDYSAIWKRMLGYAADEIGGDGDVWLSLVHPDDRERAIESGKVHEQGLSPIIETQFRMRHKDGGWRWMLDRGKVVAWTPEGQPARMIGAQTDITRQKEAEETLGLLNERMSMATAAGGVGLWHCDLSNGRLTWDARTHALFGTDPATFRASEQDWLDRLHPEEATKARRAVAEAIERDVPFDLAYRIVRPDGETRYVRSMARVVHAVGKPDLLVGAALDVTEQTLAARSLADEKERLRVTLESIGDAVLCTDLAAIVTFANAAAEALLGLDEAAIVGRHIDEVFAPVHEETGERLPRSVCRAITEGRTVERDHHAILRRNDGTRRAIRDLASPLRTAHGEIVGAVLVLQDVTAARALQRQLAHAATHDALTDLLSRAAFEKALAEATAAAGGGTSHALLYIDLDRFKVVNDSAGHAAGDALLKTVARALQASVRQRDIAARLGGDEFAALLVDCDAAEAAAIGQRVLETIGRERLRWDGKVHDIGCSIGLCLIDGTLPNAEAVLACADAACYTAKSAGRNRLAVYSAETGDARRRLADIRMASGILDAISDARFRLYAQDIRDLAQPAGPPGHLEVLVRMRAPDGTILQPGAFIPAAERFELMGALDRWVIRTTLRDFGPSIMAVPGLTVAINLSANSLSEPSLWPYVAGQIEDAGLDPARLVFEITETAVINDFEAADRFVLAARERGCRISLDDFGAGLSSFGYLKRFAIDAIKIDGAFVRDLHESRYDGAIVRSIVAIAREIGVVTIAEQIERPETVELLRAAGVGFGQGYLFGRPAPLDEVLTGLGAPSRAALIGRRRPVHLSARA